MTKNRLYYIVAALIFGLTCWLFIGILRTDRENSITNQLFVKKKPTFQMVFRNPCESVPRSEEHDYRKRQDENGNWLPNTQEFFEYIQYCRYKFGISTQARTDAEKECPRLEAIDKSEPGRQ